MFYLYVGFIDAYDDQSYSGREIYSPKASLVNLDSMDMDCLNIIRVKAGHRVRITFLSFDVDRETHGQNW